jgi:hypothetical protein
MKRLSLCLFIFLFFFGCSYEENTSPSQDQVVLERYTSWMDREEFEEVSAHSYSCFELSNIAFDAYDWTIKNIQWSKEKEDYWQSSRETVDKGSGDCEDRCILMYTILLNQGVKQEDMDLLLVGPGEDILHCELRVGNEIYFESSHVDYVVQYKFGKGYLEKGETHGSTDTDDSR